MKRKLYAVLVMIGFAGFLIAGNFNPEADKAIYKATIKHVDEGGNYLMFQNQTALKSNIESIFNFVSGNFPGDAEKMKNVVGFILDVINLEAFVATAESSRAESADILCYKSFLYTKETPVEGFFFDLFVKENKPFSKLNSLPLSTRLALNMHLAPYAAWNRLLAFAEKSEQEDIINALQSFQASFEEESECSFAELMQSIEGEVVLIVTAEKSEEGMIVPRVYLEFPDKNGILFGLLKTSLADSFELVDDARLVPQMPFAPEISFINGKVLAVLDPAIFVEMEEAAKTGGLAKSAEFAPYFEGQHSSGISFFVLNTDREFLTDLLNQLNPELLPVLEMITAPKIVMSSNILPDGYACFGKVNFNMSNIVSLMPILYGLMLPALGGF